MPGTSLEHYIHVSDLFLAATTQRTASSTPVTVWQALTGASRSTVYEWLEHGPHGVVQGHRARLERADEKLAAGPKEGAPAPTSWRKRSAAAPVRFGSHDEMGTVSRVLQLYNRIGQGDRMRLECKPWHSSVHSAKPQWSGGWTRSDSGASVRDEGA